MINPPKPIEGPKPTKRDLQLKYQVMVTAKYAVSSVWTIRGEGGKGTGWLLSKNRAFQWERKKE